MYTQRPLKSCGGSLLTHHQYTASTWMTFFYGTQKNASTTVFLSLELMSVVSKTRLDPIDFHRMERKKHCCLLFHGKEEVIQVCGDMRVKDVLGKPFLHRIPE